MFSGPRQAARWAPLEELGPFGGDAMAGALDVVSIPAPWGLVDAAHASSAQCNAKRVVGPSEPWAQTDEHCQDFLTSECF